ncbi:MAG: threonylcarbamoyl-AMP synthase [Ignavibacteria bacterium CG_4_8_14_3_um_filter_37_9]|nr:threonylcarbamoyl-AMP synthase [Ignavibacteria bacterium]OIO14465.1 MAG: threonylcarbamoyl-AMP synthase [Ignavibacteria bacterium CG1_02_37_35]PIP79463.1 MAG: threonylcarbamoyl-AMP synthase [Ignavibacteria bacterium CG22_combo_CG10-13_8_21_14_all_37_15]PIS44187.1 MAG: threonylcarbamoyl-AMP synthase [Ignavibacteria bacterium CG08_land_8_20_14_0_20_37_9]PIW99886.1 MAG: threonylcarbamoyl-AMP synthase [Ignavibacteria bacterium CG_4_8_14_3_um_filter_37_9]PIX94167.1 MAG: threonylcarbamoyl-AMP syn
MEFFDLHPVTPQQRLINKAAEVIKEGGIIIYPTDTVYGLGCDIFNKQALERLFQIKNDAITKMFSFVCADLKDIAKYAKVSDYAYRTMKHLLPGAYTFVLPAAKDVPKKLWSKRKTVGIRVPNNEVSLAIARAVGNPIISTSVTNRKGEVLSDVDEIRAVFNPLVDLMLSIGNLSNQPSSVIDLSNGAPEVLRVGAGDVTLFA